MITLFLPQHCCMCFQKDLLNYRFYNLDHHLHETTPAAVKIQNAGDTMMNLLCERGLALLLYYNRQCFIFFSRYHLWGFSGLNFSPDLLFSSHAPLGNTMNQWQTAQSPDSGTCRGGWGGAQDMVRANEACYKLAGIKNAMLLRCNMACNYLSSL